MKQTLYLVIGINYLMVGKVWRNWYLMNGINGTKAVVVIETLLVRSVMTIL